MRDKKLVLTKVFYFRDLTFIQLPKGIYVVANEDDTLKFNMCRKTFGVPVGTPVKNLSYFEIRSILTGLGYVVNKHFLSREIFDTTNISVKERGIEYRMPLPGLSEERIVIPLSGNLSDNSRAIAAILKIRSFHRKVVNDIDPSTLVSWILDDSPHHDR